MIANVVGARPNFMKMGPVVLEMQRRGLAQTLIHTGQHYDANMSQVFFDQLGLPRPDVYLDVGSGTHAKQTAAIMIALEDLWLAKRPSLVLVAGDVNSTAAAALVAAKLTIPVAHLEAGLRSFDRAMPEEVNRVVTDHLSDVLLTTEPSGDDNLLREGVARDKIHRVGNCMIDSLLAHVQVAKARAPWSEHGLAEQRYALLTLHRPSNVDDPATLDPLLDALFALAVDVPIVFPVHPRTRARIEARKERVPPRFILTEALPYLTFIGLMARAQLVLTDSGGVQEETTALGVPCLTIRENTERPVTIDEGTNILVGTMPNDVLRAARAVVAGEGKRGRVPALWEGRASERVVDVIERFLEGKK